MPKRPPASSPIPAPNKPTLRESIKRCSRYLRIAALLVWTNPTHAQIIRAQCEITASDAVSNGHFGYALAANDAMLAIGSPSDGDNGFVSGSAYLFDRISKLQMMKIIADDGAPLDRFGEAVALSETTLFVGAPSHDAAINNAGAVYAYDTTTGQQRFKLLPNPNSANALFGSALAVRGNILAVGAHRDPTNGVNAGLVYLFDATTGDLIRTIQPNDAVPEKLFGRSITLTDTRIYVGAIADDENGTDNGAVYAFEYNGTQSAKLLCTDTSPNINFGRSIDADETRLVVGAPGSMDRGAVFVYNAQTLEPEHLLLPQVPTSVGAFGRKVVLESEYIAVAGTPQQALSVPIDLYGAISGLHLARMNNFINLTSAQFGSAMVAHDDLLYVGDYLADAVGSNTGAVSAYDYRCLPDFDNNYRLEFFDISLFINAYNNQEPAADFNHDGNFTFFDVSQFILEFIEGCP